MKHRSDNSIGRMACTQDLAAIDVHYGSARFSDLRDAVGSVHV